MKKYSNVTFHKELSFLSAWQFKVESMSAIHFSLLPAALISRIYVGFVCWRLWLSAIQVLKLPVDVAAVNAAAAAAAAWPAGNYRRLTGGKFSRTPGREPWEPLTTNLTAIRHAQLLLPGQEEHSGVNRPPANCRPWLPWWIARDSRKIRKSRPQDPEPGSETCRLRLSSLWWFGTSHKSRTFYLPERMRRPFKAASWVCKLLPLLPVWLGFLLQLYGNGYWARRWQWFLF